MKIKAKYPIKVGNVLIPRGEIGTTVKIEDAENVRRAFPNLKEKGNSDLYLVQFPTVNLPFICGAKQIEILED